MSEKIVLAYSGGVDTSYIIAVLKDQGIKDIIAYCADVGQNEDMKKVEKRAYLAGASKVYVDDLKKEFAEKYILPSILANSVYENKYFLATALSRPLIAKKVVEIAKKEKATIIAHGCTGKGNDQVRFEMIYRIFGKSLKILAPMREWNFISREDEIDFLNKKGILVDVSKKNPYSYDRNLWGVSIECGVLENPENEPSEDAYVYKYNSKTKEKKIKIGFKSGIPISLDGNKYSLVDLIEKLNEIGGAFRVGRADLIENRVVGFKSREIYEAPAAFIIYHSKQSLEEMTLDKDTLHFKSSLSLKYSDMIYEGKMISPLKEYLDVFFKEISKNIEGEIGLRLFDRGIQITGRKSEKSLYSENLATYTDKDIFDRTASEGFIKTLSQQYK